MTTPHHEYRYHAEHAPYDSEYLMTPIKKILAANRGANKSLFELGCGNGFNAKSLSKLGYNVVAVDTSESGIRAAQASDSGVRFEVASAYDDLQTRFGRFPLLLSIEVVEHVFLPKVFAKTAYNLLDDNGVAVISTPYHGYLKNVMIALSGKFDTHVNPLWDGGHIKFWSKKTITKLLLDAGFTSVEFTTAGRVPWLAKSMIAIARK